MTDSTGHPPRKSSDAGSEGTGASQPSPEYPKYKQIEASPNTLIIIERFRASKATEVTIRFEGREPLDLDPIILLARAYEALSGVGQEEAQ